MHNDYKGCEILFPDTVFYINGKAKTIVRSENFCLVSEQTLGALLQTEIYEYLAATVLKRFREEKGQFQLKHPDFKMSMNSKALQGV